MRSSHGWSAALLIMLFPLLGTGAGCQTGARPLKPLLNEPLPDPYVTRIDGQWCLFGTQPYFFMGPELEPEQLTQFDLHFDFSKLGGRQPQLWGITPYQHTDGSWHLYATLHLGYFKTVIGYFTPVNSSTWTADKQITHWRYEHLLVGDPEAEDWWCYESKPVRTESGDLYLVYNDGHTHHGDVSTYAQRMTDPATPDKNTPPHVILKPEGFTSEDRNPDYKQITEGFSTYRIDDTWVAFYSCGDFVQGNYKLGVAFSAEAIPAPGKTYEKVILPDPDNIWGNTDRREEVLYLLQSQHRDWPNFSGDFIQGPGLGSIVQDHGQYWLVCHGYPAGVDRFRADHREVWKLPLEINIDPNRPRQDWVKVDTTAPGVGNND